MHEVGIAAEVLEAVRAEAVKYPNTRVCKVGVRVGEWSGVDTESLRFCLEALRAGTELEPAQVEIEYCAASPALDLAYVELENGTDCG
jgi:hydrogenase nickel incorporation protein HypA/HybF